MTSNLEVALFHWKNTIDSEAHRGEMVDAIKKIRAVPGAKNVRWGIQFEDPKIAVMFAEWDSLDSYHAWTKSPEYPAIKQTAVDKVGPPSYDPTVPPLHIRHIDAPSSVLSNILACRVIETYTLTIPASLSVESARKDIDGFCRAYRDKLTELLVWNASKDNEREIIAVVGWDTVQQHLDAVRADWVQEASEKTLGPMEKNYMVHWKMQDE